MTCPKIDLSETDLKAVDILAMCAWFLFTTEVSFLTVYDLDCLFVYFHNPKSFKKSFI